MKAKFLSVICAIVLVGLQSCSCKKGAEAIAELSTGSWELEQTFGDPIDKGEFVKIPVLNFDKQKTVFLEIQDAIQCREVIISKKTILVSVQSHRQKWLVREPEKENL